MNNFVYEELLFLTIILHDLDLKYYLMFVDNVLKSSLCDN